MDHDIKATQEPERRNALSVAILALGVLTFTFGIIDSVQERGLVGALTWVAMLAVAVTVAFMPLIRAKKAGLHWDESRERITQWAKSDPVIRGYRRAILSGMFLAIIVAGVIAYAVDLARGPGSTVGLLAAVFGAALGVVVAVDWFRLHHLRRVRSAAVAAA